MKLEWQELWDAMDSNPNLWIETTKAMYWEMLGAVPPLKMLGDNFMVGEPLRHNAKGEAIHSCFTKFGDTYKAKNLTLREFMHEHGHISARELR
jgi:hypothetical protein